MASTLTGKHSRNTRSRWKSRVGDMTLGEFRAMMNAWIDARLTKWVDPDAGLESRPQIIARV